MKLYNRLSRYLDPYLGRLSLATACMGAVAGFVAGVVACFAVSAVRALSRGWHQ